jgi:hypothetical protein
VTLYLETNALVGIAADQQRAIADTVYRGNLRLLMPSCCVMEAYTAVSFKDRGLNALVRSLGSAINDYGRNPTNSVTSGYIADLSTAQASIARIQNDMQIRLADCIDRLTALNAFFDPSAQVVQQTTRNPRLIGDPTDNFIALAILADARCRGAASVFYTEDRKQDSFASLSAAFAAANVTMVHDFAALAAHLAAVGFNYIVA